MHLSYPTFPRDPPALQSDSYRFYRVLQLMESVAPGKVGPRTHWLDVGCHSGALLRAVFELYKLQASGCDVYPEVDKEESRYEGFQLTDNRNWSYRTRDVSKGLHWNQKFEVISALEVIEHIIDTDSFLDDVREHLAESGLLLLTTPNINNLRNRFRVPLGKYPIGIEYRTVIHHVRLYNPAAIRIHLGARGFEVLGVWGVRMLPQKWIEIGPLTRAISEVLSSHLAGLATNIVVIARKRVLNARG
jgi:2-polyprenyl-3-methyl-5-hydroxy-6-metoxy-1,4-benzoquinol methylase